jgi:NAD(P)H dehydrogenase (quinone)
MKHLVIVAHPVADSFTTALTRAYTAQLEQLGHGQRTYDLYRMEFDPVLTAEELSRATTGHAADPGILAA